MIRYQDHLEGITPGFLIQEVWVGPEVSFLLKPRCFQKYWLGCGTDSPMALALLAGDEVGLGCSLLLVMTTSCCSFASPLTARA